MVSISEEFSGGCFDFDHVCFQSWRIGANTQATRRQKAIPWDAWAREHCIGMNCEVKLVPRLIS